MLTTKVEDEPGQVCEFVEVSGANFLVDTASLKGWVGGLVSRAEAMHVHIQALWYETCPQNQSRGLIGGYKLAALLI